MARTYEGVDNETVDRRRGKGNHYSPCLRCNEFLRRTDRDVKRHYESKHPGTDPLSTDTGLPGPPSPPLPHASVAERPFELMQGILAAATEPMVEYDQESPPHFDTSDRQADPSHEPNRVSKRTETDRLQALELALALTEKERDELKRERDEALSQTRSVLNVVDAGIVQRRGRPQEVDADVLAVALGRLAIAQKELDETRQELQASQEALAQVQTAPVLHWFKTVHAVELVGTMQLMATTATHLIYSASHTVMNTINANLLESEVKVLLLGIMGGYGQHLLKLIPRIFSKSERLIMTVHNETEFDLKLKGQGVNKPANSPFKGDIISVPATIQSNSTATIEAFSPLEYNLWSFIGGVVYELEGLQDMEKKPVYFVIFVQATKQKVYTTLGPLNLVEVQKNFDGGYCTSARERNVLTQWEEYQASAAGNSNNAEDIFVTQFRIERI
ncbi:hypothetical protein BC830DRAFT_1167716 [Chytriomyces sp. MP71]|nr:hypothetical protein BC830DRAFT_1167716 [Chytriomyces sp. MP71]